MQLFPSTHINSAPLYQPLQIAICHMVNQLVHAEHQLTVLHPDPHTAIPVTVTCHSRPLTSYPIRSGFRHPLRLTDELSHITVQSLLVWDLE